MRKFWKIFGLALAAVAIVATNVLVIITGTAFFANGLSPSDVAPPLSLPASVRGDIYDKYMNKTSSELEETFYKDFEEDSEWGGGGLDNLSGKSIFGEDKPNEDSDGDRLTNAEEEKWGTNPHDPDTDGDLMTDGGEVEQGTDPLDPNEGGAYKQF